MGQIARVGVDIVKSVFHVHAVDRFGERQWKRKYCRTKWLDAIEDRVPKGTEIAMEACGSSHYWGRELQKRGFKVKIILMCLRALCSKLFVKLIYLCAK